MYNKMKLKPFVIPMIYGIAAFILILSVFFLVRMNNNLDDTIDYVDEDTINQDDNDDKPVVSTDIFLLRPYNDTKVGILKSFYDYQADEEKQKASIIFYENTYIQNSGVDYGKGDVFDVLSVLDGTVLRVKQDNVLGNWVEIRHTNDLITTYQCLSEVSVKENDTVTQGQVIGKSGTCNIAKDLANHLHFELFYKGSVVDPELYFDKKLKDLE